MKNKDAFERIALINLIMFMVTTIILGVFMVQNIILKVEIQNLKEEVEQVVNQ